VRLETQLPRVPDRAVDDLPPQPSAVSNSILSTLVRIIAKDRHAEWRNLDNCF
jgi:hypothetical protein